LSYAGALPALMVPVVAAASLSEMRVLVVDDSALVRGRLLEMLRDIRGVHAQGAHDAGQALALLGRQRPDIVVLDLRLGGSSGLELLGEVRRTAPEATVIVLTNDASELHRRACLGLGARHFLDKSRDFERAVEIVAGLAVRTEPPKV
jgi:two-component system, OmpR family, response regulator